MVTPPRPIDTVTSPPMDSGSRLYGVVDVLRPDRAAGWAVDRSGASAAPDVEIRREGRRVATLRADRLPPDLAGTVTTVRAAHITPAESLGSIIDRIELAQARIEAALNRVEPPDPPGVVSSMVLWLAAATACASIMLGALSLIWP